MRIVNERIHTNALAVKVVRDGDDLRAASPADDPADVERREAEFGEDGVAEVDPDFGAYLVDTFDPVREAEGPDDHAEAYTPPSDDLEDMTVAELEDRADSLDIDAEDIEGSGADGNVVKADWIRVIRDAEAGN